MEPDLPHSGSLDIIECEQDLDDTLNPFGDCEAQRGVVPLPEPDIQAITSSLPAMDDPEEAPREEEAASHDYDVDGTPPLTIYEQPEPLVPSETPKEPEESQKEPSDEVLPLEQEQDVGAFASHKIDTNWKSLYVRNVQIQVRGCPSENICHLLAEGPRKLGQSQTLAHRCIHPRYKEGYG